MRRRRFIRSASLGLFLPATMRGSVIPFGFWHGVSGSAPVELNLIHGWNLYSHSGDTIPDTVGSLALTNHGGTFDATSWRGDGESAYCDTSAWTVGANNVSILVWVHYGNVNRTGMFVDKEPVNGQWELYMTGGLFTLRGGGVTSVNATVVTGTAGLWRMLVGTISGTTGKIYINGSEVASGTVNAFTDSSSTLQVGRYISGFYFSDWIGRVQISNTVWTAAQISAAFEDQRGFFGV